LHTKKTRIHHTNKFYPKPEFYVTRVLGKV